MAENSTLFLETVTKIKFFIAEHPHVAWKEEENAFVVETTEPTGYDVALQDNGSEMILWGGKAHLHVGDAGEAAAAFMWMLTPHVRVCMILRRGWPYKTWFERDEGGTWRSFGTTVYFFNLFARSERVTLQNRYIERGPPPSN